jgi:hypothetical protein
LTSRSRPRFSAGGSWAEPLWKTAHKRIPTERVRFRASLSYLRLPPLVPGLFWFRARVILLTDDPTPRSEVPSPPRARLPTETSLALHPTRPKQRFPMPARDDSIPHPEPPLLLVFFPVAPSPWEIGGVKLGTWSSPGSVADPGFRDLLHKHGRSQGGGPPTRYIPFGSPSLRSGRALPMIHGRARSPWRADQLRAGTRKAPNASVPIAGPAVRESTPVAGMISLRTQGYGTAGRMLCVDNAMANGQHKQCIPAEAGSGQSYEEFRQQEK